MFKIKNISDEIIIRTYFDETKKNLYVVVEQNLSKAGASNICAYAILKTDFKHKSTSSYDFVLYKPMSEFENVKDLCAAIRNTTSTFQEIRTNLKKIAHTETVVAMSELAI
jgi:hypothetical protein